MPAEPQPGYRGAEEAPPRRSLSLSLYHTKKRVKREERMGRRGPRGAVASAVVAGGRGEARLSAVSGVRERGAGAGEEWR